MVSELCSSSAKVLVPRSGFRSQLPCSLFATLEFFYRRLSGSLGLLTPFSRPHVVLLYAPFSGLCIIGVSVFVMAEGVTPSSRGFIPGCLLRDIGVLFYKRLLAITSH
jgi:hypothetical protein